MTRPTSGSATDELFLVTVQNPTFENEITVNYSIAPVTAVQGVDFQYTSDFPQSGHVDVRARRRPEWTFTQSPILVSVLGNTEDVGPRTLDLTLSDATNATIDPNATTATATIESNAQAGTVPFSIPATTAVPSTGGTVDVTVTRTDGTASGVTVNYAVTGGAAPPSRDFDYVPTPGPLTFGYQSTLQTIPVQVLPDPNIFQPETIDLALNTPTGGATLGQPSTATITIEPFNSLLVTNTNDDGFGSLRRAIEVSNLLGGTTNTITFAIPGAGLHVITPASPLPPITTPVSIDARTEPGYAGTPVVELNGSQAGAGQNGLVFYGGNSAVYGLAVGEFGEALASSWRPSGNVVQADRIGTDEPGADDSATSSTASTSMAARTTTTPAALEQPRSAAPSPPTRTSSPATGSVGVDVVGAERLGQPGSWAT